MGKLPANPNNMHWGYVALAAAVAIIVLFTPLILALGIIVASIGYGLWRKITRR